MSTQITHICAVRTAKPTDHARAQNGDHYAPGVVRG